MTQQFFAVASNAPFNVKRKNMEEEASDQVSYFPPSFDAHLHQYIRSPPLKRRATFPVPQAQPDDDMAMDEDPISHNPTQEVVPEQPQHDDRGFVPRYDYEYGMSGSGGIGFGPGAEEDEDMSEETMGASHSPISAQPYSSTLAPPQQYASSAMPGSSGVFQPSAAGPLPIGASEIEKARASHGPQCKSIPKLVVSPYPNPLTGKQAMYTMCPDCGSCEQAA